MLKDQIRFFREKQSELVKNHPGKFVLIHKQAIVSFHESHLDAYTTAKDFPEGSFLIRECLKPTEEKKLLFHSRVA